MKHMQKEHPDLLIENDTCDFMNNFFIEKDTTKLPIYEEDIVCKKVLLTSKKIRSPISSPIQSLVNKPTLCRYHSDQNSCSKYLFPMIELTQYRTIEKKYQENIQEILVSKNYLLKKNRSYSYDSILNFYTNKTKRKRWFYNKKVALLEKDF